MPYDDPAATDPLALHGVAVETRDDSATREMAECFVEEYLRIGFDADRILKMFRTQGYAGPFLAYQTLGEEAIRHIIDELRSLRGGRAITAPSALDTNGRMGLVVLET